jgi:hypothetical protein
MIMSFEELSQILEATGMSSSQEEHILTVVKNLSTSPKDIEKLNFHEPHPWEDPVGNNYIIIIFIISLHRVYEILLFFISVSLNDSCKSSHFTYHLFVLHFHE